MNPGYGSSIFSYLFSRAWRPLHVFASGSDWLVVLFASACVAIAGQSNYFGFGFTTIN